ncbi:MAG: hypothetical protein VYA84_12420 [Planctomycetota bacterium]|nr:hypothetical protein [Planctomycetota bacterium]
MWNGSRLYQDGRISAEQFADAICHLANRRKKLGQLAMVKEFLSAKQVMNIFGGTSEKPGCEVW